MLGTTSTYAASTARPGTVPASKFTSRRASIACANVATKSPMAIWLGLSCRIVWTMRGENWPIASCTTTIVTVRTSAHSVPSGAAVVLRIAAAASGPPVRNFGTSSNSVIRSIAIVPNDNTMPASTQSTGMNQTLVRTLAANLNRLTGTAAPKGGRARGSPAGRPVNRPTFPPESGLVPDAKGDRSVARVGPDGQGRSRRSSRRSMRRLTPWLTTAAVPTTAAVRATGAPITPRRAILRATIGMSGSSAREGFFGLERGDDGLDRDPAAGDELATGAASGRRERCRPPVLPDEHARGRAGLHRGGEVFDVVGREDLRELSLERSHLVHGVEV